MKINAIIITLFSVIQISCSGQISKINGVSFVASNELISEKHVSPVININANYAAIMPFGFIRNLEHPEITYDSDKQWIGETRAGAKQYIETLRKQKIKIMIKPQIWVWHGEFTGFIKMTNDEDWKVLETAYLTFILNYAQLAQDVNAEIFCIGTELENFIHHRPKYWNHLIDEVKKIYKGKLTYAANWDEFKRTPFWDMLDFIGIDAYFPVSDSKTPTLQECKLGWKKHKTVVNQFSAKYKKPVLFTEFGYRSVDFSGREPWKSDLNINAINLEAQTITTQALFEEFWKEDWFAGGFVWKWFHDYQSSGGINNSQFTPQNKPVELVIKQHYSQQQ